LSSRRVWGADHDLLERFLADSRHQSIFCWIAHWDEDKSAFVGGTIEQFSQKAHRIGSMGQGSQAGERQGRGPISAI